MRTDDALLHFSMSRAKVRAKAGIVSYQINQFYAPVWAIGGCKRSRDTILDEIQTTFTPRTWVRSLGFLIHVVRSSS